MNIRKIIREIKSIDNEWLEKAKARTAQLAIPPRALGKLHDVSEKLCGIAQTLSPDTSRRAVLVMAGDHGVAVEGVSAFPQEVTGEMVRNFLRGGAGINVLARMAGAEVIIVDMGIIPDVDKSCVGNAHFRICKVGRGTANIAHGSAMSREQAEEAILKGFSLASEQFSEGIQIIGTGDMGIANTTPSAAIGIAITGISTETMVGRGTGVNDQALANKRRIVEQALAVNRPDPEDGLDVLFKVGGFEIGGIAGCVLAAAYHRRPVVIDGFISTAGALIAYTLCPRVSDYVFAGHCSQESGHRAMLKHLGIEPLLDLGLRLGEGTGAVLAMNVVEGAVRIFKEVLTFEEAEVTNEKTNSTV